MNKAQTILNNAESKPELVREQLVMLHEKGETVADILEFVKELEARKVRVKNPGKKVFDVCGTGGSGKQRINLSTPLAIQLSENFCIAKHGNRAASGKVGSFDLIEKTKYEGCDTPEKVRENLENKNCAFVFAPAFHPALKPLAPIRKSIPHPTIFNYLGPLLNPVENLTAQMTGISDPQIGDKLAEVAQALHKNILFVHDAKFGLDDVSIGGETIAWEVRDGKIKKYNFVPEDLGFKRVDDFSKIQGGDTADESFQIFEGLLSGKAPEAHLNFLDINREVAADFFKLF